MNLTTFFLRTPPSPPPPASCRDGRGRIFPVPGARISFVPSPCSNQSAAIVFTLHIIKFSSLCVRPPPSTLLTLRTVTHSAPQPRLSCSFTLSLSASLRCWIKRKIDSSAAQFLLVALPRPSSPLLYCFSFRLVIRKSFFRWFRVFRSDELLPFPLPSFLCFS